MVFDKLNLGVGAIAGAVLMFASAFFIGQHEGKQVAAAEALETSVRVLRQRNQINDEVSGSDAAAVCGSYGLSVDEQAECVRRVAEAAAEPGHDGLGPPHRPALR